MADSSARYHLQQKSTTKSTDCTIGNLLRAMSRCHLTPRTGRHGVSTTKANFEKSELTEKAHLSFHEQSNKKTKKFVIKEGFDIHLVEKQRGLFFESTQTTETLGDI